MGWSPSLSRRHRGGLSVIVSDTFTRADSVVTLGSAETGQAWTASALTFGISSNKAYVASGTGAGVATVNSLVSDNYDYSGDVTWRTGDVAGLCFNTDGTASNRFALHIEAANLSLYGAADALLGQVAFAPVDNTTYALRVVKRGTSIVCTLNGTNQISVTSASFPSNTKHGISLFNAGTATSRWDNIRLTVG